MTLCAGKINQHPQNAVNHHLSIVSQAVGLHVALTTGVGDAPHLPFAGELLVQHLELVDELLAYRGEDVARGDCAVRLHSDKELWNVGVADFKGILLVFHARQGIAASGAKGATRSREGGGTYACSRP